MPVACSLRKDLRTAFIRGLHDLGVPTVEVYAAAAAPGNEELSAAVPGSNTSANGEAEV